MVQRFSYEEMYLQGMSLSEVAIASNCSVTKVRNALLNKGVVLRKPGQRYIIPEYESFKKDCEELRWHQLVNKYGVSWQTIKSWKQNYNLTTGKKEDRKIIYKEVESGCWKCTSHKKHKGYPRTKEMLVAKKLWIECNGNWPDGAVMRHLCHNKWCINPVHIIPGSQFENLVDSILNNNSKTEIAYIESMMDKADREGVLQINGHEIIRHCDGAVFQRTTQGFVCVNEGGGRTVASESES